MEELLGYNAQLQLIGDEASELLERVVTCRIDDLSAGDSRVGALLTPQGKIIADFVLYKTDEGFTLWLHEDALADMEKRMKLLRLRKKVTINALPPDSSGSEPDHEARIIAGRAVFGADFGSAEVFPTDVNLDHYDGIDYKKGCFVGQEVASRMKRRGNIRRRTLVLSGNSLEKGTQIKAGDALLGTVTSSNGTRALATIRLDRLNAAQTNGEKLTANEQPVSVIETDWLAGELEAFNA